MEKVPVTLLKEYVESQQFESTTQVMTAMKKLFAQVLQQIMECELDTQLGYEKSERVSNPAVASSEKNYRKDYSKKIVKTQLGEVELKIPRDRNGEFEPHIISKYSRNVDGIEEKSSACTPAAWVSVTSPSNQQALIQSLVCGLEAPLTLFLKRWLQH